MTRISLRGLVVLGALALVGAGLARDFARRTVRAGTLGASVETGESRNADGRFDRFLDAVAAATPRDATVCVLTGAGPGTDGVAAYRLAPRRVVGPELYADATWVAVYRRGNAPPPAGAAALPGGFLQKK